MGTSTPATSRMMSLFAADSDTATEVSTVIVCTAELCMCQDEGFGGGDILETLRSKNLPYAVEEAHCLGACGGGAMVAIDFEDGTSALVSGMDKTLMELGLSLDDVTCSDTLESVEAPPAEVPIVPESINCAPTTVALSSPFAISATISPAESKIATPSETESQANVEGRQATVVVSAADISQAPTISTPTKKDKPTNTSPKVSIKEGYQDARDRMRAQAAEENTAGNPWWNVATYLAQKATESIMDQGMKNE